MNKSTIELQNDVIEVIKTCHDPEIPVNIYELGLIYPGEVEDKIKGMEGVEGAKVTLTFDPPWTQDLMSEAAKLELGMF